MTTTCSIQKFLMWQTHMPTTWHNEIRNKVKRTIETETRCQSQIYSWSTSSGARQKMKTDGVESLLDEVPICNPDEDILSAFFGANPYSLQDSDFIVQRILNLLMKNWNSTAPATNKDFHTAKTVYDRDFQAAQELVTRHRNTGLL